MVFGNTLYCVELVYHKVAKIKVLAGAATKRWRAAERAKMRFALTIYGGSAGRLLAQFASN